jgi:hypothetical protein
MTTQTEKLATPLDLAAGPFEANAAWASSWSGGIYLTMTPGQPEQTKGWATLDAQGVAICAAAQAAGKTVFFTYASYDPNWGNHAGSYDGVKVALQKEGFPTN